MSHITLGETGLISSAVAVLAILTTWTNSNRSVKAQARASHVQWLADRRADVYVELLKVTRELLDLTKVSAVEAWPSEPRAQHADTSELQARVSAFGSKTIGDLYEQYLSALKEARQVLSVPEPGTSQGQISSQSRIVAATSRLEAAFNSLCVQISREVQDIPG